MGFSHFFVGLYNQHSQAIRYVCSEWEQYSKSMGKILLETLGWNVFPKDMFSQIHIHDWI